MPVFQGLMDQAVKQGILNKQAARPMDPYKAGGPSGYMARVNRMRMGGRYQPGGDPRQQGGSGKANRQTVPGNAGGNQSQWPGGPAQGGGLPSKLLAGAQQGGRGAVAGGGKPNRQTVPPGTAAGQPGQVQPPGGRAWAGGSPGWATGGGRGIVAGDVPGRGGGGKPNRQTVPGNAGGGAGGLRRSWRGKPVNPTAKRKQAQRTGARGGRFGGTTASRQARQRKTAKMRQGGTFG